MLDKRIFTSQTLRIHLDDGPRDVDALVSENGAKNVFRSEEMGTIAREYMHRELLMEYQGLPLHGRISKEVSSEGVSYHVRFTKMDHEIREAIRSDVKENGLPSPWRRSLPRITARADSLTVPSLGVLFQKKQEYFLGVRNFTLGGILFEYLGSDLSELVPGVKIEFDLVTNFGDKITRLSGKVAHITYEYGDEDEADIVNRMLIGVQFLQMSFLNEAKYKAIIREYCLGLQEGRS